MQVFEKSGVQTKGGRVNRDNWVNRDKIQKTLVTGNSAGDLFRMVKT